MPKGTGSRKHGRVALDRPGFVVLEPDGPWIECFIVDVSEGGACINVGALAVTRTFVLVLSSNGEVKRVCQLVWRNGELLGAKFVTARDLRKPARRS